MYTVRNLGLVLDDGNQRMRQLSFSHIVHLRSFHTYRSDRNMDTQKHASHLQSMAKSNVTLMAKKYDSR